MFGLKVAAYDATAHEQSAADWVCAKGNDEKEIQQALCSTGGVVHLSSGHFDLTSTLDVPEGKRLVGSGRGATTLRWCDDFAGSLVLLGEKTGLESLRVLIPESAEQDAIVARGLQYGPDLRDLMVDGGAGPGLYAVQIEDTFNAHLERIWIHVGCNGVRFQNVAGVYNYGNLTATLVEVSLEGDGLIGWDFDGVSGQGTRNYNLMAFTYISALTPAAHSGAGSVGMRIRNCSFMSFVCVDLENCETSLVVEGLLQDGARARANVFVSPLMDATVELRQGARLNSFLGGQLLGEIVQVQMDPLKRNRFYGVMGNDGKLIPEAEGYNDG